MKAKVENVTVGNFEFDSIEVTLGEVKTQICFEKSLSVAKYIGKEVELVKKDGIYSITEITTK